MKEGRGRVNKREWRRGRVNKINKKAIEKEKRERDTHFAYIHKNTDPTHIAML